MKIPISKIRIEERHRKDLGDLASLAESMRNVGLLQPVVVDKDNRLIAGERRIQAALKLGWKEIHAFVATDLNDAVKLLTAERDENTCRKDLAPSEAVAIGEVLRPMEQEAAKERQKEHGGTAPGKAKNTSENFSEVIKGETDTKVAKAVGMSAPTYRKAAAVVAAAEKEPEKYAHLVEEMDKNGKVDRSHKKMMKDQRREKAIEAAKKASAAIKASVHCLDFRNTADLIKSDSVDLVFTDPPYAEESISLYKDVAAFAARVLRPGGWCLTYSGHSFLPQIFNLMSEHLEYGWCFAVVHSGGDLRLRKYCVMNRWKPIIGFYKPPLNVWWEWFPDVCSGGKEKSEHEWQQAVGEAEHFIRAMTAESGVVCDPMCGSGTTLVAAKQAGRKWIGIDMDQDAVNKTLERLSE